MHRMLVMVVSTLILAALGVGAGQSQTLDPRVAARPAAVPALRTADAEGEGEKATRVNQWTVGVAGGQLEGTFARFAVELAKGFDDGEEMRVLPIVTYGATENVSDLLYLKGVDIAITHADVFEEYRKKKNISNIDKRVNYISPMFVSEVYILARPEIKSIKDLEGKTVSLGVKGAGQTVTGPIIFNRMGVHVNTAFMSNGVAYEKMKSGELAALVHSGGKPNDFIANLKVEPGFHLLEIPYGDAFADYYVPTTMSYKDYPNLLKEGEVLQSIGNLVVLAVYNWPAGSDRARRVERFIDYFFERFDKLKGPTFHPKWKEINLAGTVPGWQRYPYAEKALAKMAALDGVKKRIVSSPDGTVPTASTTRQAGAAPEAVQEMTDEQRLFEEFVEWKKKGKK